MMRTYKVVRSGLGGMLNPPGHAEHNFSVSDGYGSRMALTSALNDDRIPDEFKDQVRLLLLMHEGTFTEEWEHTCYNYFRNCYSPDGVNRDVSCCLIDRSNKAPADHHLAVMHIRLFFPTYIPNYNLIKNNGDKGSWSSTAAEV
ncbi:hypothetical protein ACK8P5_26155 (plasmid) [Paenibacillus sp. EC2-1]|uniref:hypothetical protein n=1 Tax=Paenibacillus sp. EC2-1 TaxID=3388665 RepID=UPI003BEF3ACD